MPSQHKQRQASLLVGALCCFRKPLIFDLFRAFPGFFNLFPSALFDRESGRVSPRIMTLVELRNLDALVYHVTEMNTVTILGLI
jgi:hypothetical protein